MKITNIEATDLEIPYPTPFKPAWQPGLVRYSRGFTIVKIETSEGIIGYTGRDGHYASTVETEVKPYMIGKSVYETEEHARIFRNANGMWFLDLAIWDIIGKSAGLPLYKLWGYARNKVKAYASASELGTAKNRVEVAKHYKSQGFQALKIRFHNDHLEDDLNILDQVMEAVPDMDIMVDANQAEMNIPSPKQGVVWDYRRAFATAKELEKRGVIWLEEPLSRYDFDNLIRLRKNTNIYIAGGEMYRGLHEFRWLIEKGVYDIIQPDCAMSEGISQLRKVAGMAEINKTHFVPHHGLSGLGLAAVVHISCSTPGMSWIEMMYEPNTRTIETYQQLGGIIETSIWIDDEGYVHAPEQPGLGVTVNEEMMKKYH